MMLAPLFMMLEVGLELMQPRFMARIIDDGVAKGDMRVVITTCLLMLGTSTLAVIGGIGCTIFSCLAGQNFGADIREDLFSRVLDLSFAETDKFTAASLITRLTQDVNHIQHFMVMMLRMLVRQPLTCIGGCIMALSIDVRLASILLLMIPIAIGIATIGYRIGRPMFGKIQKKMDALNAAIQEMLAGIRVVKAYSRQAYERERFTKANEELAVQHIAVAKFMSALFPFAMFLMNMGILLVLYKGGLYVKDGTMTVGEVMAMISYISQILFSFMAITHILNDFARTKVSASRIQEVLDTSSSVTDNGKAEVQERKGAELEFRNVTFKYPLAAGQPILQGLSFTLKPGKRLAILGATGSGKSTIAHLIPRFYDCSNGAILLNGKDIREYSLHSLRNAISIVLQDAVLFSGTIDENIRWGNENATEQDVRHAAETAQAHSFATAFKDGYATIVGQRGVTLSGGQKQRVSIARAIVRKPQLLILDDCASALDVSTEQALHKAMGKDLTDVTILVIAQRVSSARNADEIMVLSEGHCVGYGTHDELLKTCPVYREIVSSQTGEDIPGRDTNG